MIDKDDIRFLFWQAWENADEIKRADLVKDLLSKNFKFKDEVELYSFSTLINSYFVDLYEYTMNEWTGDIE